ncbi:photosystem II protein PsbQ [Cyanobium sp. Morenito 9A2]|uniref:photosystem II protein PsbQ n=1 Tax=Cyanobium sp. Morenito 9A2 TaxID=2823718 RepID=UPI0020CFC7B9|nr:photosystem II protein PsbQ [Cyanobium sp. Morenito 9A2]MCP9850338.1 photosystem II protein PsbQ [Cyanobium sp. Morenito 9A2]
MAALLVSTFRRFLAIGLAVVLSFALAACSVESAKPPTISSADLAMIQRQAEGFLASRNELTELASLVNDKNWVFTRNLIHGPFQEMGRQMLYINQRLLPADRPEANQLSAQVKSSLAQLDEAARLQDGDQLRKSYIKVASSIGRYAQVLPDQVKTALNQV